MPELPDLAVLAEAFDAVLTGRPVTQVRAPVPLVLRATPARAAEITGQVVTAVTRRGKHLVLHLERDDLWAAPMLTGRFALVPPALPRPAPSVALAFGPRLAAPRPPASWIAGAAWLPPQEGEIELRYLDPSRMGKLYTVSTGTTSGVPGIDGLGPDADDPSLTLAVWRARIRRHPGELKALLRNQAFVAGIGNAYSDEILWAAGLSPFRRRASLADEEVDALHGATRETLAAAIELLRARVPPAFEKQVRDRLRVHLRGGSPCPRCGARISQLGSREVTSYCRSCQR